MATTAEINRSLLNKKIHDFYVLFYQISENTSNILGRQVQSLERPNITFNETEIRYKGIKNPQYGRLEYNPISITFLDDTNSLVNNNLYHQIMRQTTVLEPDFDTARFEINVKVYSGEEKIVENFTMKGCYITSINHSEQIYTDSTNNLITATINFRELDYEFPVLEG